jgi:hypothetical protein
LAAHSDAKGIKDLGANGTGEESKREVRYDSITK